MNDNYLWNRTGEPDREVQELEEILGTLRYEPRPLEIPAGIHVGRRRTYLPALAIAAAIALIVIGLGLWFNFNRRPAQHEEVKQGPVVVPKRIEQKIKTDPGNQVAQDSLKKPALLTIQKVHSTPARNLVAANKIRRRTNAVPPQLTPEEIAEKEQVLTALRLVSAKLNLAQRRTQGMPPLNLIRNQHKIG
jgi:hypothetical protein